MKTRFLCLPLTGLVALMCGSCHEAAHNTRGQAADTLQTASKDSTADWALIAFTKADSVNPVLQPGMLSFTDPVSKKDLRWEEKDVFNPAVVVKDGKIFMLYRAQDKIGKPDGTSRIGLAETTDGIHFTRHPAPVLYPDNDRFKKYEWPGGCEDPRVVQDDKGTYYMTYTAYDGVKARLFIATSPDLVHWTKHGSAFSKADKGYYADKWTKSGAIVSTYEPDGRIIATKINGRYWMYWGDKFIWAATSNDLINWAPVEMGEGEQPAVTLKGIAETMPRLKIVMATRNGKFDNDLVESGPPAMITDNGILLIYNSRNVPATGDTSLPEGAYTAGEALFDKNDPTILVKRLSHNFIRPDKPYEISGQVNQVCFLEGLARFHDKWWLYYGTADSKIAVATRPVGLSPK